MSKDTLQTIAPAIQWNNGKQQEGLAALGLGPAPGPAAAAPVTPTSPPTPGAATALTQNLGEVGAALSTQQRSQLLGG